MNASQVLPEGWNAPGRCEVRIENLDTVVTCRGGSGTSGRTEYHENGLHVATIMVQDKRCVWWATASGGSHAKSLNDAQLQVEEELNR